MVPIDKYYGGHGVEVMKKMMKRYGKEKGEQVFYATMMKKMGKKRKKYA